MPLLADAVAQHVGDELVADLGHRLQPVGTSERALHGDDEEADGQQDRQHHEQRGSW